MNSAIKTAYYEWVSNNKIVNGWNITLTAKQVYSKRSPRPIDVFSLGRLTLFGMVRLCARQGVPGELISEGVATA